MGTLEPSKLMGLIYRNLPEASPDLSEDFIRVCLSDYEAIADGPASSYRLKPWKVIVVGVWSESVKVWRILKRHGHLPICGYECWMGPATCSQLDVAEGFFVEIGAAKPQWLGRLKFYNNHLSDVVRFSFCICLSGLVFAVVSIFLSLYGGLR